MSFGAKLQLRQSQSLAMTPQLLQSIRLLQLSSIELERFVAEQLESNPLLARDDRDEVRGADPSTETAPVAFADGEVPIRIEDDFSDRTADRIADLDASDNLYGDETRSSEPVSPTLDYWRREPGSSSASGSGDALTDIIEATIGEAETLHSHVRGQLALLRLDAAKTFIAHHLIDALDDNGYLTQSAEEIAETLAVSPDLVAEVLESLGGIDPPGLFATSLQDCLARQLAARDRLDPAMAALLAHLPLLAKRDFATLEQRCGVGTDDLVDMLAEIRALDPRPGAAFATSGSEPVVPDALITAAPDGGWRIELNPDAMPRVLVDRAYYKTVLPRCSNEQERSFLGECLQSATWLERSLDQRAKTMLAVIGEIVRQQDAFLLHGVSHLRPMSLRGLAEKVEMHESTISRVTMNKFVATPRGVFDLRYFFTVSIAAAEGEDAHSAESIRHRIRAMIDAETAKTVLSDDAIVEKLKAEKVDIARRTVAKYRESMNIPSSVQRRREKRALALSQ